MNELDYVLVLKALQDIPFSVGKKLLIDYLRGKESNESITKNKLHQKTSFASMAYSNEEIEEIIDNLLANNLIQVNSVNGKKFWKVLELTDKGIREINNPQLFKKKLAYTFKEIKTEITEDDKKIFGAFGDFLAPYNDEQKKAIISNKEQILCIAGAGSGKTTVLTKRIEFLIKYKSIKSERILAVTFTRKARLEMMRRLKDFPEVNVETFNSFCEKILKKHNDLVYEKEVRVVSYRDKIVMINKALASLNTNMERALNVYFSFGQRAGKTPEQLARIFLNDCFFILDYFKFKNKVLEKSAFQSETSHGSAELVFQVCKFVDEFMKKQGLRDYADQLVEVVKLFEANKDTIPEFDHVLIDEYQDVNSTQTKLIDLLNTKNIFCVGDPRQSIFGWRGSDIKYILNFGEKYPNFETITLTTNYRSTKHIVDLINTSIKNMKLPDLNSSLDGEKDVRLLNFENEASEFEFVIQRILASAISRKEIFVLARTNKQLSELSQLMKLRNLKHIIKNDETISNLEAQEDEVTLATIHAIKGLEAEMVFVIGCNNSNFPCKASEHPVIEMVKVDEYDKEEEERRLFYVAMSRAKKSLYLTYTGKNPTNFVTKDVLELIQDKKIKMQTKVKINSSSDILTRLKDWRREISTQQGLPAFIIMHDKTLVDLAQKMPSTIRELKTVHGMGPNKINRYGEEILSIISQ